MNTNRTERIASRWIANLSTVPSGLGRLLILSSFRDLNTGFYIHHGLELDLGGDTHSFLLSSHEEIFAQWQSMTMEQKMRDLRVYIRNAAQLAEGFGRERNQNAKMAHVLNIWAVTRPYRNFVPFTTSPLQLESFLEDVTALVNRLKNQILEERSVAESGVFQSDCCK